MSKIVVLASFYPKKVKNKEVKEIFIEIDNKNLKLKQILVDYGFTIVWEDERAMNTEALFIRT